MDNLIVSDDEIIEATPYDYDFKTGYYELLETEEGWDKDAKIGDILYVIAGKSKITVLYPNHSSSYDLNDPDDISGFRRKYAYSKDGHIFRQKQIGELFAEIEELNKRHYSIGKNLIEFNPYVEQGELASNSLVPVIGSMTTIKKTIAETRNDIARIQKLTKEKTDKLELMLSEQTRALSIQAKELKDMLGVAEEAIWTINLYLGKNEEIHVLAKGKRAPQDTKIKMRQKVLYMDEECAINAGLEGIDFQNIEQFDEWIVANPNNLQQVLPDDKGILALHIKRYKKEYNDSYANIYANAANLKWTYFLIRNGENLYRVYIDLMVHKHLFPSKEEILDEFKDGLKPGSKEYMKALESSEESHRHNMRIMLVLQGLLDRTNIFKPLPERINVCDYNSCCDYIEFIYDDENLLSDGRDLFSKWQKDANGKIEVGMRIILSGYGVSYHGGQYEDPRIHPKHASVPESLILHTITKQEDSKFYFHYNRTDKIYSRSWYTDDHDPKIRASCWILKTDDFILNYDAVTLTDLEYYEKSRNSRHLYNKMIPLLKIAIELKKKEIEQEEPFKTLLVDKISKRYGTSKEKVLETIDDLITWWKFKTRIHRALLSDDVKAYQMIIDEFGLIRDKERARQERIDFEPRVVDFIRNREPTVILIAHKNTNQYVAYVPHNQNNVWVKEQVYTLQRDDNQQCVVRFKKNKDWQIVDKRHERWRIIDKNDRWDNWTINPIKSNLLTDPEIAQILNDGIAVIELQEPDFLPLCACYNKKDFSIWLWCVTNKAVIPTDLLLSSEHSYPELNKYPLVWKRHKGNLELYRRLCKSKYGQRLNKFNDIDDPELPWNSEQSDDDYKKFKPIVIKKWPNNFKIVRADSIAYVTYKKEVKRLERLYDYVLEDVAMTMNKVQIENAHMEYINEHGAPDLWEDYLKSLNLREEYPKRLDQILMICADRHINPVGKSLKELFELTIPFHASKKSRRSHIWDEDNEDNEPIDVQVVYDEYVKNNPNVPMDYIVKEKPIVKENENHQDEDDEEYYD